MKQPEPQQMHVRPEEFFRNYSVELLYPLEPKPLDQTFREQLSASLVELSDGAVAIATEPPSVDSAEEGLTLEYRGSTGDVGKPPQWRLERLDQPPRGLDAAVGQSWWWQPGRRLAPEIRGALRISDHRDSTLDGLQRVRRFRRVVAAIEQARPSLAVLWSPSQQLVDPMELVASVRDTPLDPLPGPINVRFYQTANSPERDQEFLMDTLGLGALGLTDLQCHFRGLEPDSVSQVLFETSLYLLEKGSVISEGHSVQGPGENDRWISRRKPSLAEPERDVLDLDPGFPFAASTTIGS